jgi:hypothetical protein
MLPFGIFSLLETFIGKNGMFIHRFEIRERGLAMNSINIGLPIVGQTYNPNPVQTPANSKASFAIDRGKIPTQAKNFIAKYDTNKDGVLNFQEYQQVGSLTDGLKSTVSSPDLAKALFAMYAGPSGTLNAAEWARSTVNMDDDFDGKITQAELDKNVELRQEQLKIDPELAIMRGYIGSINVGDTMFGLAHSVILSGKGDPEVAQAWAKNSTLKAIATGELGETKKANWDKLTALGQQYYPDEASTAPNDLFAILDLKANYLDTMIKADTFPKQGNKLFGDPRVNQNASDTMHIQQVSQFLDSVTIPNDIKVMQEELNTLPANHPDRAQLKQGISIAKQRLQTSQNYLAMIKDLEQKGAIAPPSESLQKVLTQLDRVPLSAGRDLITNLIKELQIANAIDYTASEDEINKSFAKVPQLMDALYKKNAYALGTTSNSPRSIEAFDPKAWGNKPQFLPFGSFSSNA